VGDLRVSPEAIVTAVARKSLPRAGFAFWRCRKIGFPAGAARENRRHRRRSRGGFRLKEALKPVLTELGLEVRDVGVYEEKPADYPDLALQGRRAGRFGRRRSRQS